MRKYTFVILGDNRSGTTSIWSSFRYHTEICSGKLKEKLHRLPEDINNLLFYVKDNFATTSNTKVLLDGSPNLISFRPRFIDLLKELPEVERLCCIYTVRKPIERLYSYSHICLLNHYKRDYPIPYFITDDLKVNEHSMHYMFHIECLFYRKIRLMEHKLGRDNLYVLSLNSLSENLYNIFDFLSVDKQVIPIKRINRSVDYSPTMEYLRIKADINKWVKKNQQMIERTSELDKEKINKRYGDIL